MTAAANDLYISCITLTEVCKGICLMPTGKRQRESQRWLDEVLRPWFADRVLPIHADVAERTGIVAANAQRNGRIVGLADVLIGSTALVHGLTLVTRNVRDFDHIPDLLIFNPWD